MVNGGPQFLSLVGFGGIFSLEFLFYYFRLEEHLAFDF